MYRVNARHERQPPGKDTTGGRLVQVCNSGILEEGKRATAPQAANCSSDAGGAAGPPAAPFAGSASAVAPQPGAAIWAASSASCCSYVCCSSNSMHTSNSLKPPPPPSPPPKLHPPPPAPSPPLPGAARPVGGDAQGEPCPAKPLPAQPVSVCCEGVPRLTMLCCWSDLRAGGAGRPACRRRRQKGAWWGRCSTAAGPAQHQTTSSPAERLRPCSCSLFPAARHL